MAYELIDFESGNTIVVWKSLRDAEQWVLEYLHENGIDAFEDLGLGAVKPNGIPEQLATGADIVNFLAMYAAG